MIQVLRLISADWNEYFKLHKSINFTQKCIFLFPMMFHNPGMFFSVIFRFEHYLFANSNLVIRIIGYLLYPIYFLLSYYILDYDIHPRATIGKGMYIHNKGIIIARCDIGNYVKLLGPITIGLNLIHKGQFAKIGNSVTICTGARIIGNVKIGDNVIIGANAVVVDDVKKNLLVGGVPAKILKSTTSRV